MKNEYVLLARGKMNMPQLEISVGGSQDHNAIELAKLMVAHLTNADYTSFELFNIGVPDHVRIARIIVEPQAPIIRVL